MIALSVLVLGLASAIATRLPVAAAAAVVALFAMFHGHAHFMELAAGAAWGPYVAGMVLATALLHAAGMGLALGLGRLRAWLPRSLGAATALAGAWMLVS
jgi:urease accessory protein